MSSDEESADGTEHRIDPRRTGYSVEKAVDEIEEWGDDPEKHYYMTTYSDTIHTTPRCPHIQDTDRLHFARDRMSLNGPYRAGAHRVVGPTSEHDYGVSTCNWCEKHG